MGNWMISLLIPVLLHMAASELVAVFLGGQFDSTVCTMITSVIVIPIAAGMYRNDVQKGLHVWCTNAKLAGRDEKNALAANENGSRTVGFGIFCFLVGGILNLIWSNVLTWIGIQETFSNQVQERLLAGQIAAQILGLGILVPVAEELIFRGLIYNRMKGQISAKMAILFSALLFALYHGNPIQIIFAFPMALVLAAVYEYGGLFIYPMLFHMGANLLAVLVNFF